MDNKILNAINELKNLIVGKKDEDITDEFNAKIADVENQLNELKTENETLKTDYEAKISEKETAFNNLKSEKENLQASFDELHAEFVDYAKAKLDRLQCEALGVDNFDFIETEPVDNERRELILGRKRYPSVKDEPKA